MTVQTPALVIFDCDGVLVDSEPPANRTLCEAILELGLPATLESVTERFKGRSLADCVKLIEGDLGHSVPADFLDRLNERTYAAFRLELRAVPGVRDAVSALTVPYCVASSGSHEKMRFTLGLTGLLPLFEPRLYSATQVAHGKPAPDVFLLAARSMGIEPERTVVVEDSVPGVSGGVAAGMRVLGFAREGHPDELRDAGAEVFFHMDELLGLLPGAGRGR